MNQNNDFLPKTCPYCQANKIVMAEDDGNKESSDTLFLIVLSAMFLIIGYFVFVLISYLTFPLIVFTSVIVSALVIKRKEKKRPSKKQPYFCLNCQRTFYVIDQIERTD